MTAGSYFSQFTIIRVGYIRAFVLFASLMAISTLIVGANKSVAVWILFRFLCGYSLAALFIIIESWCILSSDKKKQRFNFFNISFCILWYTSIVTIDDKCSL